MTVINHNLNYKDSLFRHVFNDKESLLELYNAINGTSYTEVDDFQVTTLEDAIYMGMKNDVSFLIGGSLNLYEHQSTANPNMPIRGVLYLSTIFKAVIKTRGYDIYSGKLIELPNPQYIVFYNGTRDEPDVKKLRLSDAFVNKGMMEPCLECVAIQLNINSGHNPELMGKCRRLYEYSAFVQSVRDFRKETGDVQTAIEQAVDHCIEHDILKEFLIKSKAEVSQMLLYEYDEETHIKNEKDISWQEGREEGIGIGRKEGIGIGREEGIKEGEKHLSELVSVLMGDGKFAELERAMQDETYRHELYAEYGIVSDINTGM